MTIIYFILVLGITVFVHELGHFICAKRAGIYVYEFSIGMGPALKTWKRKNDETEYSIRLFPIGGYVSMAGESVEDDEEIPRDKKLQSKTWIQRFSTMIAGIIMNFILAIVIFIVVGLIVGASANDVFINDVSKDSPAYEAGLKKGDEIVKFNGKDINADLLMLKLMTNGDKEVRLTIKHEDGSYDNIKLKPEKVVVDDEESYKFGFSMNSSVKKGFFASIKYGFTKFWSLIVQMVYTIFYLFTGKLS